MSDRSKPAENAAKKWKIGQPVTNEDFIHEGEEVLWEGKPADFKVISPQSRREILEHSVDRGPDPACADPGRVSLSQKEKDSEVPLCAHQ